MVLWAFIINYCYCFVTHHPLFLEFPITQVTAQSLDIITQLSEEGHLGRNNMIFHNSTNCLIGRVGFYSVVFLCLFLCYFFPLLRTQAGDSV